MPNEPHSGHKQAEMWFKWQEMIVGADTIRPQLFDAGAVVRALSI
jgi:hypothetical protein